MGTLIDAFRTRAQEQQREKELMQRIRRRSSLTRGSFLTGMAGKRIGGATNLRRHNSMTNDRPSGPWDMEMLEAKLQEQETRQRELRSDVKVPSPDSPKKDAESLKTGENVFDALDKEKKEEKEKAKENKEAVLVPVLEGLTVDELLQAHGVSPSGRGRSSSLQAEMQASLEEEDAQSVASLASLSQRLQQTAYGYQSTRGAGELAPLRMDHENNGERHVGHMQLEAPLHNTDMWALLPVRKPLLTKRSRRCRLARKENAAAAAGGKSSVVSRSTSSLTRSGARIEEPSASGPKGQCGKMVVKPQINPCSNPPFQKNNTAVSFIPRCTPWAWQREGKGATGGLLNPGESAEIVFGFANPLDSEMQVSIDPAAFNPASAPHLADVDDVLTRLFAEQNVEVLTVPFQTTLTKFNDLADVHEAFGEEGDKTKKLKDQDDPDVIPGRKLHKILIRIRFQGLKDETLRTKGTCWVFFVKLGMSFKDPSSGQHDVNVILRFAMDKLERAQITAELPQSRASARQLSGNE